MTMRTSLYEKVFVDGFAKASYVVVTLDLPTEGPSVAALTRAIERTLDRHPRLRSRVIDVLGVPAFLDPRPPHEWTASGGLRVLDEADLHTLEERLLTDELDPRRAFPVEAYLVRRPSALVVKVHHAMIDAASGFGVLRDLALAATEQGPKIPRRAPAPPGPIRRLRRWLGGVQLRPRLPEVSLVTDYHPRLPLRREQVRHEHVELDGAYRRVLTRARQLEATFSELFASALLSAMAAYNAKRAGTAPSRTGLMFARAGLRGARSDAGFRSDTCVVAFPTSQLRSTHDRRTLAELRRATREPGHNDVALLALYAARKLSRRREASPEPQRFLHFTLSDLTGFGARGAMPGLRVLASPTSYDHAGMLITRAGDALRVSVVAHEGALDAAELLSLTLQHLGEETR